MAEAAEAPIEQAVEPPLSEDADVGERHGETVERVDQVLVVEDAGAEDAPAGVIGHEHRVVADTAQRVGDGGFEVSERVDEGAVHLGNDAQRHGTLALAAADPRAGGVAADLGGDAADARLRPEVAERRVVRRQGCAHGLDGSRGDEGEDIGDTAELAVRVNSVSRGRRGPIDQREPLLGFQRVGLDAALGESLGCGHTGAVRADDEALADEGLRHVAVGDDLAGHAEAATRHPRGEAVVEAVDDEAAQRGAHRRVARQQVTQAGEHHAPGDRRGQRWAGGYGAGAQHVALQRRPVVRRDVVPVHRPEAGVDAVAHDARLEQP